MTAPAISQPTYSGGVGHGISHKEVTVMTVDTSTRIATCRDRFGKTEQVRCDIMRAKGNLPEPRERWLIDRQYGQWTFAAILTGGTDGVIIPTDNVTGLNEFQSNTDERLVGIRGDTVGQIQGKGDILSGGGTGTISTRSPGVDNQYLVANSGTDSGLDWVDGLALAKPIFGLDYPGRYVGNTGSGWPTSGGPFRRGDWVHDAYGYTWTCTIPGSVGWWSSPDYNRSMPAKHSWSWSNGSVAANTVVTATGYTTEVNAGFVQLNGPIFQLLRQGRWSINCQVDSDCPDAGVFTTWIAFSGPNPFGPAGAIMCDRRYRPGNGAFHYNNSVFNPTPAPGASTNVDLVGGTGFPAAGVMSQSLNWCGWVYPPECGPFSLNFYWNCPAPTQLVTASYRINIEYMGGG